MDWGKRGLVGQVARQIPLVLMDPADRLLRPNPWGRRALVGQGLRLLQQVRLALVGLALHRDPWVRKCLVGRLGPAGQELRSHQQVRQALVGRWLRWHQRARLVPSTLADLEARLGPAVRLALRFPVGRLLHHFPSAPQVRWAPKARKDRGRHSLLSVQWILAGPVVPAALAPLEAQLAPVGLGLPNSPERSPTRGNGLWRCSPCCRTSHQVRCLRWEPAQGHGLHACRQPRREPAA